MTRFLTRLDPSRYCQRLQPAVSSLTSTIHSTPGRNTPSRHIQLGLPLHGSRSQSSNASRSSPPVFHPIFSCPSHQRNPRATVPTIPQATLLTRSYHSTMPTRSTSVTPGVSTATTSTGGPASAGSSSGDPERPTPQFEVSPVPPNPLGEGRCIRTAAALIIGDEILNGKTLDSNSHVFAQFCFQHGIDLKRIEVIPDVEDEIIEAARRLSSNHDLVVTSGGIGPTHDDITYASLAKAFNTTLVHHDETIRRMKIMNKHRKWATLQTPEQKEATLRMALFPANAEVIFVDPEIWVPVVRLGGKLCVFPGVPGLFQRMIKSLANFIPLPPKSERPRRIQIFTDRAESLIAPYLTKLQARLRPHNIQVGSYPILYKGVFVSLIGKEAPATAAGSAEPTERVWLADIAKEVEREIGGRILSEEEVVEHKKQADLSTKWEEAKGMLKEAEAEAKEGSHRTVGLKAKI